MSTTFALDRWHYLEGSSELQTWFSSVAARSNQYDAPSVFGLDDNGILVELIDHSGIDPGYWEAVRNVPPELVRQFLEASDEPNSRALFPGRATDHYHVTAINTLSSILNLPFEYLSYYAAGQGFTGSDNTLLTRTNDPLLARGTQIHDLSSLLDLLLQSASNNNAEFKARYGKYGTGAEISLNDKQYGTSSVEGSALVMAGEALFYSVVEGFTPPSTALFDYLGISREKFLSVLNSGDNKEPIFFSSVTILGKSSAHLASTLAYYYGSKDVATQIVTQAFAKTVGGVIGDGLAAEFVGSSLQSQVVLTRFAGEFGRVLAGFASSSLASALNETFDIESPLGQFVTTSLSSAVTKVFMDRAIHELSAFGLSERYARNVLGIGSDSFKDLEKLLGLGGSSDLTFTRVVLSGEIVTTMFESFDSFVYGELFKFLDQKWTTFNLSNLGSGIGGIIGNFIAPGIGGFIGQVAGGIVFDILDGTPRSFHNVLYDAAAGDFIIEFAFSDDDGQTKLSKQLAESAMSSIQLATILIGGELKTIPLFTYGHYEEQLTYEGAGSGRVKFTDANQMLARGVIAQLRAADIEGGNPYAKDLLMRLGYSPSLDKLFNDLGVADIYNLQKGDPYLFGMHMINLLDEAARRFVLTDWQGTLDAAYALSFHSLSFNDGAEFLVRVSGNRTLSGERGNDFLYAEGGWGALSGGDGDDIVRFDVDILASGRDELKGGAGTDRYEGDFSRLVSARTSANGIEFYEHNPSWYILEGADGSPTADFVEFEQFSIIGSQYNDYSEITERVVKFDGGGGTDTIDLQLSTAAADIVLDIDVYEAQLSFDNISIRNVERVSNVLTGSGNDTIRIGTALLADSVRNNIDTKGGFDLFEGDFSSFVSAGTGVNGIEFYEHNPSWYILEGTNGVATADFHNFERFLITGTRYDDSAHVNDKVSKFDGKEGTDTINVSLASATSNVVLDLDATGSQLIFGAAELRGVERVSNVVTGSGNDTVRIGIALLVDSVRNNIDTKGGFDLFEGDFSSFVSAGTSVNGIEFYEHNPSWYILEGTNGVATADFHNFERFLITGTPYDDSAHVNDKVSKFDGKEGTDTINVSLASATSNVVLDLDATGSQLIFGATELRGVERVSNVVTGSGNDTVRIGIALLVDSVRNNIDTKGGFDLFEGDFSSFVSAGTSVSGIEFYEHNPSWYILEGINGVATADFHNFERFLITGTRYDDSAHVNDKVSKFDGKEGTDTINVSLGSATSNVVLDLDATGSQLIFEAAELRGVERVSNVVTGSGNDTVRIGIALLVDSVRNNIDPKGGFDLFEGDFSSFVSAGTSVNGIEFYEHNPSWYILEGTNGVATADFRNFERFLITGTRYDDKMTGAREIDRLNGFDGNDTLDGGAGNDVLIGGTGSDALDGGNGFDVASYVQMAQPINANFITRLVTQGSDADTFIGIEGLFGSTAADSIRAADGPATQRGETLRGGAGNDTIDGGRGVDTAEFSGERGGYAITRTGSGLQVQDIAAINGNDGTDTLIDIERLVFADRMLAFGTRAEELARVAFVLWTPAIVGSSTLFARGYSYYDNGGYSFEQMCAAALSFWPQQGSEYLNILLRGAPGTATTAAELNTIMNNAGGGDAGRVAALIAMANDAATSAAIEASGIRVNGVVSALDVPGFGPLFGLLAGG